MKILVTTVLHMKGNFRKDHPKPTRHSVQIEGQWFVVSWGPTYHIQEKVTEFDVAGEAWLLKHEQLPPPAPAQGELL